MDFTDSDKSFCLFVKSPDWKLFYDLGNANLPQGPLLITIASFRHWVTQIMYNLQMISERYITVNSCITTTG